MVGLEQDPLTTERDHRVKVQFSWQRGARSNAGGLPHDERSADATGNAPGNQQSGTWVRVALPAAGANWGAVFTPRIGTEVAVEYIEGDIDRPLIVGQLYNGADTPPFSAGVDSGVNHPGVISGAHSHSLDGSGFNQWVIDDASGQLRMRLHCSYTAAEIGLGHLIQQSAGSAQRGAWRGHGFEAGTQGWASLRAAQGLLISTTNRAASYGSAQSTQMDAAEAVAQLKAARDLGQRLSDAAQASTAHRLSSHQPAQAVEKLIHTIDVTKDGHHPGPVNGQDAKKPGADGRSPGTPVEMFATPVILLDTPSTSLWSSEAQIASHSGQDTSLVAQGDLHQAAAHTHASISGQTTSWFTHEGGIKAYAANGPISLQAHTDELQIWADKDATIISVNDEIHISASTKIELIGGQSQLVLEGGDITFSCPGHFQAKGSGHAFLGGGGAAAAPTSLPIDLLKLKPQDMLLEYQHSDGKPVQGAPFEVTFADGSKRSGTLDASGRALLSGVPKGYATVHYGEDSRKGPLGEDEKNPLVGWM